MLDRNAPRLLMIATLALVMGNYSSAPAKDIFLTVGGGYGAQSTQLSLERNVLFQQSVLAEKRADRPQHVVLFGDGQDAAPDVQCRDPDFRETCPTPRRMLAELLGDASEMDLYYRTNEIPNVEGPSESASLKRQLRAASQQLEPGDRLIVYATGHGGPAQDEYDDYDYEYDEQSQSWKATGAESKSANKHNTSLYFYDGESVTSSELAAWLDRVPRDVQVVLIMVQCYAGGFAHTIFHQADAELGLAPHARCGFFAQVHDRGSAGCTPNANEAEYEEYSSYFWGALAGRSRTGDNLASADYDQDGHVSFAEAHAYAIIESETIDIPVRTSDAFLRHYSNLGKEAGDDETSDSPLGNLFGMLASEPATEQGESLRELTGTIADIAAIARPDQRAILEQLSERLELGESPTIESVQLALKKAEADLTLARVEVAAAAQRYSQVHARLQEQLLEKWPELNGDYAPLAMALVSERAEEFVATVEGMAAYEALGRASESQEQHQAEAKTLSHREARLHRLLLTCKSVVLAANLPKIMPSEMVDRYKQLVAMEEGTL